MSEEKNEVEIKTLEEAEKYLKALEKFVTKVRKFLHRYSVVERAIKSTVMGGGVKYSKPEDILLEKLAEALLRRLGYEEEAELDRESLKKIAKKIAEKEKEKGE